MAASPVLVIVEESLTCVVWSEQLVWFVVLIRMYSSRLGFCQLVSPNNIFSTDLDLATSLLRFLLLLSM